MELRRLGRRRGGSGGGGGLSFGPDGRLVTGGGGGGGGGGHLQRGAGKGGLERVRGLKRQLTVHDDAAGALLALLDRVGARGEVEGALDAREQQREDLEAGGGRLGA